MNITYQYNSLLFSEGQLKKDIQQEGYSQVVFPVDAKSPPQLKWQENAYYLTDLYILSRPVHSFPGIVTGEMVMQHMSPSTGVTLCVCAPLTSSSSSFLDWIVSWRDNPLDRMVQRHYGKIDIDALVANKTAVVTRDGGRYVLLLQEPIPVSTPLPPFQERLTGDPVTFARGVHGNDNEEQATFVQAASAKPSVVEGFDFQNDMNGGNLSSGFGTFGNTINQAGSTMNQAGEDYIFDFKTSKSADSSAPAIPNPSDIVQCIPLYDNTDQVSTFVVPYGSAMSDEITKMFMTGTFQMFYTLLIAFVILFLTPILYKNYFAIAKRHGSSDDIEYGNKITYSCNIYFVLFSIIMIVGVLVDAAMYTHSITEMGFAMMLIIFFMCTYLFTLMLRGAGLDPSIYGHLQTKVDIMELINLYGRFMGENFNSMYTVVVPAILILLCFGISVGVFRSKSGDDKSMPFGNMIAVFFIGLFMILATFGTFFHRSIEMSAGDAVV